MDFRKFKNIHLTGIKGVGMTALALYFQDMRMNVSGSDVSEVFVTDEVLKKRDIKWRNDFDKRNVAKGTDLLITTAAHGGLENEEVKYAKLHGIKVLTYAEALAEVSYEKETVCVCGVGGKTTTCSMLSVLLDSAGLDPSFVVGVGSIFPLGVSGRYLANGRNFICEGDEYVVSPGINNSAKFSLLKPKIIIVTNIEYDHPDVYKSFDETKEVFLNFFSKLPKYGSLIVNADNINTMSVVEKSKVKAITYGFDKMSDYRVQNVRYEDQKTKFDVYIKKKKSVVKDVMISVPGEFNIRNAASVFAAGDVLGIEGEEIKKGLARYLGCRRRFEDMGNYKGAKFFDDYAHHPGEIKETLKAVRAWFPKRRIVVIFQPHTYSRTKALFSEFSKSFKNSDVVALMDIYASAREKDSLGINSSLLADETKKYNKKTFYVGGQKETLGWIDKNIKSGDVVLTMGAGDIFHLYTDLKLE
jgi:UDP-N-acetylmuramate--alanine ligase